MYVPYKSEDPPTESDLAEEAHWDRVRQQQQMEAERAARARGEWVPSPLARILGHGMAMRLDQRGIHGVTVIPARDGVFRLAPRGEVDVDEVRVVLADDHTEVAEHDHTVWVRVSADHPLLNPPY